MKERKTFSFPPFFFHLLSFIIDFYYQHRVDPNVAIEETIGAMAALIDKL
ncbi:aldo/keto reductase [Tolypothrix sp. NIES-4075]|nr:hypothetical protein [Tolypothrix sp. NIES-4075]GAX40809.1 aldo/keto reductase [Tolypothrix sp. NIES-4075]